MPNFEWFPWNKSCIVWGGVIYKELPFFNIGMKVDPMVILILSIDLYTDGCWLYLLWQKTVAKLMPRTWWPSIEINGWHFQLENHQIFTRWWFQIFFIFNPIWGRFPFSNGLVQPPPNLWHGKSCLEITISIHPFDSLVGLEVPGDSLKKTANNFYHRQVSSFRDEGVGGYGLDKTITV